MLHALRIEKIPRNLEKTQKVVSLEAKYKKLKKIERKKKEGRKEQEAAVGFQRLKNSQILTMRFHLPSKNVFVKVLKCLKTLQIFTGL